MQRKGKTSQGLFADFPPLPKEAWEERIKKDLKGRDYSRTLLWEIEEGLELRPYYRSQDLESSPPFPSFTKKEARICQTIYAKTPQAANARAREFLSMGMGAESLAFAMGTSALDSFSFSFFSDSFELHEPKDLQLLLEGIDLNTKNIHFLTGLSDASFLKNLLLPELKRRSFSPQNFYSLLEHDLFSHWLRRGSLPYSILDAFHKMADLLRACQSHFPNMRCLCIADEVYHLAGASPAQSLGLLLAALHELLISLASDFSFSFEDILPHLWFKMSISSQYFIEIARLRALRLLYLRLLQSYKPDIDPSSALSELYIHGESSLYNKTLFDSHSNIMRSSTESMAALLGGVNSFSCLPFDILYEEGSDVGNSLSLSTQLLHRHECYLSRVSDPAAGSYYIEKLTDSLARGAWAFFQEIEKEGGLTKALQSSKIQERIIKQGKLELEKLAKRKRIVLGSNAFPPPPSAEDLEKFLPPAREFTAKEKEAVQKGGEYEKILSLPALRLSENFERLRLSTLKHAKKGGRIPQVFLLLFGDMSLSSARANFARNFFGCAGYPVLEERGEDGLEASIENIAKKVLINEKEQAPSIIVACSSDTEYPKYLDSILDILRKRGLKSLLYIAANPKKLGLSPKEISLGYVYEGLDLLQELGYCQKHFGIPFQ